MPTENLGKTLRGVNLGGWLVLEKWMTPSLFEGWQATDETTFCVELGERADSVLHQHWNTFITRDDFAWLAAHGLNAVRLPVGHWLFGPDYPYHRTYGENPHPFVQGGVEIVDRVFDWAEELGLRVILDLHAAPGCQNGFDNGGIKDVCEWHTKEEYIQYSCLVLERLAERYHARPALHAIEVLNEPRWDIDTNLLKDYYTEAYRRIRRHCLAEKVAVSFNDGFRSFREFLGFMQDPALNVAFNIHRYQCFDRADIDMDIYGHVQKAAIEWKNEADDINRELKLPTYLTEWSLGLDLREVSLWASGPFNHALEGLTEFQRCIAMRGYAATQIMSFERYNGWFFWSYKTETTPAWCFRESVNRGWLPENYAE